MQVANFRFAQGFGGGYELGASFVYWTLSLEEQFYMFLPFLVSAPLWYRLGPEGTAFDETYYLRFILTSVTVIVVFSELNYRFVETPMRTYGAKVADKLGQRRQLLYRDQ